MKWLRPLVVVALLLSLAANALLYMKSSGRRVMLRVNDAVITQRQQNTFLLERFGIESLATLAKHELVRQAAARAKVLPDKAEIDEIIQDLKEQRPAMAVLFKNIPVREKDYRSELEFELALVNLRTADVQVTDDEVKEHFAANPGKWDKPAKAYLHVLMAANRPMAERAAEMMGKVSEMSVVQQNLDQKGETARIAGVDGRVVAVRGNPLYSVAQSMKPGDVRIVPSGANFVVVRLEKLVPGTTVTLEQVKNKVVRDLKLTRCPPAREVLGKLWDAANITTDDPDTKRQIHWMLFREPEGGKS